ncbi:hypothetical protein BGZ61DRAFT_458251 [Ilyonectria robusta]|uniref:uncharacterized protein n=1 Tax=Ilyonectria robusta TaxID=1079257 RepID=UPI001E8DCA0C|nr:uncharacterized protein BGZ61DRAFT_458251 [Ilyonectria robusta]KAH8675072.1 hypothetical protein BGZ61DRAFT_458251 [Ilyonectria robusta]
MAHRIPVSTSTASLPSRHEHSRQTEKPRTKTRAAARPSRIMHRFSTNGGLMSPCLSMGRSTSMRASTSHERIPGSKKNESFPFHDLDFQMNLLLGLGHSVSPPRFATTSLAGRRPSQLTMIFIQPATNTSTESLSEFRFKTILVSTLLEVRVHTIVPELQEEIDWGDGCIACLVSSLVRNQDRLRDWGGRHMCVHSLQGGLQGGLPGWKKFAG